MRCVGPDELAPTLDRERSLHEARERASDPRRLGIVLAARVVAVESEAASVEERDPTPQRDLQDRMPPEMTGDYSDADQLVRSGRGHVRRIRPLWIGRSHDLGDCAAVAGLQLGIVAA